MKKNPHAVALGKKGGGVTSERKAKAARKNGRKGGRPKLIQEEYADADGYWIYLMPGWKSGADPVGCEHQIHENTKREAHSWLSSVLPCDCDDCQRELVKASR